MKKTSITYFINLLRNSTLIPMIGDMHFQAKIFYISNIHNAHAEFNSVLSTNQEYAWCACVCVRESYEF